MNHNIKNTYIGIDLFKFLCAVLVIYIHTYCFDGGLVGSWIKNILASVSVPFFFITSGYFFTKGVEATTEPQVYVKKYLKRILVMYIAWSIITLPVAWYNINLVHNDYSVFLKLLHILRSFFFVGSIGVYWYIHSLFCGCLIWFLIWQKNAEKVFYPICTVLFIVGVMYRSGLITDTLIGKVIHVLFGSERNFLNVGLMYIGIGALFFKKNIYIDLKSSIIMLIVSLGIKTTIYDVVQIEFMESFAAIALFFVALQLKLSSMKKYSMKLRQLSTAMYLVHFPFILVFDFYLQKRTCIDFSITLLFSIAIYVISKKCFPTTWNYILFGS